MFWRQQISRQLSSSPSVTPNELLEILLAHTYGYYVLPQEPYDEVFPNIYVGDSTTALCIHLLKRLGITHVLNAAMGRQRHLGMVNTTSAFYRNAQIEFMGVEALDMSVYPLYQHFYSSADFIESALQQPNGKILVHCGEGISRSSTLVIAYLMIKKAFSVQEAIRTVVAHRNILPNHGFLLQLCQLNDDLLQRRQKPTLSPPPSHQIQPQISTESKQSYESDDYNKMGSSRSPTPSSTISSPSFGYSNNNRSSTPNYGYSNALSSYDYSNRSSYINSSKPPSSNNYPHSSNSYSSTKPMENKIQMQRRLDFRRAQSVERPNYITRGSSYLNKSTPPPLSKKYSTTHRSYHNLSQHTGFNNSLMTTYLVNRPLPAISR